MRICVLEDRYDDSSSPLRAVDIPADPERYLTSHPFERHSVTRRNAVQRVIELSHGDFDVFLNLCDGSWDEDRPGIEVVQALERLNVPFTGADSVFYDPPREQMKMAAHYYGAATPAGAFASTPSEAERALDTLRFPMIVKHANSYSSIGMTRQSRVETPEALHEQAARMINRFGAALIEEFIEGREFSVLVAENPDDPKKPISFLPIEFLFPEGESFKHFDLKWKTYDDMKSVPCTDEDLAARLEAISRDVFVGLRGTGYGRCDIRMDLDGRIFLLEINPNCGVLYPPHAEGSADLALEHDPRGHAGFVDAILRSAFNRVKRPKPWTLRFSREVAYGMIAASEIVPGQVIEPYEERSHHLVSRSHVERCWSPHEKAWFERYAYPITDEVYAVWSDDPLDWKPINHSCDPNAWLDGLNLVARRRIAAGEEITMDYATFCNEIMPEFACSCDAANCRGTIRGTDYLKPFVGRYGSHVSDYVKRKRLEAYGGSVDGMAKRRNSVG